MRIQMRTPQCAKVDLIRTTPIDRNIRGDVWSPTQHSTVNCVGGSLECDHDSNMAGQVGSTNSITIGRLTM